MTNEERNTERDDQHSEGQVSEVSGMEGAPDEPISDSQGVAGNPEAPSPEEVGEAGPNANPHADQDTH